MGLEEHDTRLWGVRSGTIWSLELILREGALESFKQVSDIAIYCSLLFENLH